MAAYFVSDIHLRFDQPARAEKFARLVNGLNADDSLFIAGDLCDFWMGSRQREAEMMTCQGLSALRAFRDRGGKLQIMAGNHDLWLTPFYEKALGAEIVQEPYTATVQGLRLHIVHGHLLGARRKWKAVMESRQFFRAFGLVPSPIAGALDAILDRKNQRDLTDDEERHLVVFRDYARKQSGQADLVILGHVHRPVDETTADPRMIVLGGWQKGYSYLKIDQNEATYHAFADHAKESREPSSIA